jgi:hypothetical protein
MQYVPRTGGRTRACQLTLRRSIQYILSPVGISGRIHFPLERRPP